MLRAVFPPGVNVFPAESWGLFEHAAASAVCAIVALPRLDDAELLTQLAGFRARRPLQPLVAATDRHASGLDRLRRIPVDEIVWLDEAEATLWPAVGRARTVVLLRQMASAFDRASHLPPRLREALSLALRRDKPARSVIELAAEIGCDRRTLWRYWREGFGSDGPLHPSQFLDWLLLLHASGLKSPGTNWKAVAAQLGVHEHTVGRLARRLAGLTLREVAAGGQPLIARLFAQHALRPLLAPVDP